MAGVVIGEGGLHLLPRRVADLGQVLRQVHHLAAEGGRTVFPLRIVGEVGGDVLEGAAAACAVANDDIGVLVDPDVLPGESQELVAKPVGQVRQTAADVVLHHGLRPGLQNVERLRRSLGKHHPHAAAVEIGHSGRRRDGHVGGGRLPTQGGRPREGGEEMRPGVFFRHHAVGKDAVETELAQERKGTRRELHHAAALQDAAHGLVFGIRRPGLVHEVLADVDHRLVGCDLARAGLDAGPAQQAEIDRCKHLRRRLDAALGQGPGDDVLAPRARGFNVPSPRRGGRPAGRCRSGHTG